MTRAMWSHAVFLTFDEVIVGPVEGCSGMTPWLPHSESATQIRTDKEEAGGSEDAAAPRGGERLMELCGSEASEDAEGE